jgi:hypothetical protein
VFLQDVNGFMVGRDSERAGIIKAGAKLVNAISNSRVPKLTVILGGSFGAGNYALCGKAFDPRLIFAWPTARCAVMGGDQATSTLLDITVNARAAAKELDTKKYAGCNIVCGDCESLWIVHGGDWLRMRSLSPGLHVLTNADINDSSDVRIREITARVLADSPRSAKEALDTLSAIACSTAAPVPICLRGDKHGTVASTLLALNQKPRLSRLLHAAGAPADCPYVDRTDLLWELESLAGDTQK